MRAGCSDACPIPQRERDLSLRSDVLFTLLTLAQLVIDVAGELSSRRGDRFEDYTAAIKNLVRDSRIAPELVAKLERLRVFATSSSTSTWCSISSESSRR